MRCRRMGLLPLFLLAAACSGPKLVIEHQYAGTWQVIDNGFTFPEHKDTKGPAGDEDAAPKHDLKLRHGVLIQLGKYYEVEEGERGDLVVESGGVSIRGWKDGQRKEVDLAPEDFHWIDIVEPTDDVRPPLPRPFAKKLCNLTVDPPCEDIPWPDERRRSLHAALEAGCFITYWMGRGQRSSCSEVTNEGIRTEFEMAKGVTLKVYCYDAANDGGWQELGRASFDEIDEVVVKVSDDDHKLNHGGLHDPPPGGGSTGGGP